MLASLCQAKYVVPVVIGVGALLAFHIQDVFEEFQPLLSDYLPNNDTEWYAIILPPASTWDIEAQRAPLQLLYQELESNGQLFEVTMDAAKSFVDNVTYASIASPIEVSFQLYRSDEDPSPDNMWMARGLLVKTETFVETQQLTKELQASLRQHQIQLQAIKFAPGPFVYASHPIFPEGHIGLNAFIVDFLVPAWMDFILEFHASYFDTHEKYVIMRMEIMAMSVREEVFERQYVLIKPDSLDLYEQIYPGKKYRRGLQGDDITKGPTTASILSPGEAIEDEL